MDSATGNGALRFSSSDAVTYLIFIEMAWVFDTIATAGLNASSYDISSPWWLSNHRLVLPLTNIPRVAFVGGGLITLV